MKRRFWKEAYRLGIDELDEDHIAICDIMERFVDAAGKGPANPEVEAIFHELRDKLEEHFKTEERCFSKMEFPEDALRNHIDGHLDVLYTFEHEFSKWEEAPDGAAPSGDLSNVCMWVWTELARADMEVGRRLRALKEEPARHPRSTAPEAR